MVAVLVVRASKRLCAIPLDVVVETMRPLPVVAHSGGARSVLGVAVVRGEPTPVVELSRVLSGEADTIGRFVSIRVGDRIASLAVDQVIGIVQLGDTSELPPLLSHASADAIEALTLRDAELVAVLRTSRVIPDDAWALVGARQL
jgi:purine-binding chemotaxis protein CheW